METTLATLTLAGRSISLITDGTLFFVRDSSGQFASGSSRPAIAWGHFGRQCERLAREAGVVHRGRLN